MSSLQRASEPLELRLTLPLENGIRLLVGALRRDHEDFVFEYAKAFTKSQMPLLPGFPDPDVVYRSPRLWPFFLVRLPPIGRPDVQAQIARRNVESDDTIKLLGSLGRKTISSPYELEPAVSAFMGASPNAPSGR